MVGYDGSDLADLALRWAVDTAALTHDPVEVLVAAGLPSTLAAWAPPDDSYRDGMRQVADQAEKRLAELGRPAVPVHLVDGDAVPELVQAGQDAGLVVVGATGHSRLAGAVVGSVSRHLATYAPGPVVVVRPQASPDSRRIVVGVDGGPSSVPAMRFALERADLLGVPLTVVHAFEAELPYAGEIALPSRLRVDSSDAERTIAEALAGVGEDFPAVEVTRETVPLRAERVLVDASEAASLVVVGARGRNAFARLLLGSVSQHVLQHAHCPVAVIR